MKKLLCCSIILMAVAGCVNSPVDVRVQMFNSRSAFGSPDAVRGMEGGGQPAVEIPLK